MDTTSPKPFVFVLMPFDSGFDDVYQLGIKPACNNAGAYAERVDEQIFTESILDRIYNQISKADLIVSDMTERNPNVFYETGYAHALGKDVILLTQKAEDIPFDLKHYSHIVYSGRIADLIPELEKRVTWALQQPKGGISKHNVQLFIDGQALSEQNPIVWNARGSGTDNFILDIDAHNPVEKQIRVAKFQLGILPHDQHIRIPSFRPFRQANGKMLFLSKRQFVLTPGSWDSTSLTFEKWGGHFTTGDYVDATVRLLSLDGVMDFPLRIVLECE